MEFVVEFLKENVDKSYINCYIFSWFMLTISRKITDEKAKSLGYNIVDKSLIEIIKNRSLGLILFFVYPIRIFFVCISVLALLFSNCDQMIERSDRYRK